MSKDLPFMAEYLIEKIKKDARIDIKRHWKVRNYYYYYHSNMLTRILNDMMTNLKFKIHI